MNAPLRRTPRAAWTPARRLVFWAVVASGGYLTYLAVDGADRLDASGAFFYPGYAADAAEALAGSEEGADSTLTIDVATYLRYLAARHGTEDLDELVFDAMLAAECERRGVGSAAARLASGVAARRLAETGRDPDRDPAVTRRFRNEALRQLRVDALVQADRVVTDAEVRALFERRYGPGGVFRALEQYVVPFALVRRELETDGGVVDEAAVLAEARARISRLRGALEAGTAFGELEEGGPEVVGERAQRRYGAVFRDAAAALEPEVVSPTIQSEVGLHLVRVQRQVVTRFADVAAALREELARGPANAFEERALREALSARYRVRRR